MSDNSSTQLAMRICGVSTQLHPHGCVGHCYFLDMNHSTAPLVMVRARMFDSSLNDSEPSGIFPEMRLLR